MQRSIPARRRLVAAAASALAVTLAFASAEAADTCKVKVNKKTGVLTVAATNLAGIPGWRDGASPDNTGISVFHLDSCVIDGNDIVSCSLADPTTVEATIPPPSCSLCVEDGSGNDCCTRIKGCTPGARQCETVTEQDNLSPATAQQLTAECPSGYRVSGGGASHVASFAHPRLTSNRPTPSGDGWIAGGYNDTGTTSTLNVFAICCRLP